MKDLTKNENTDFVLRICELVDAKKGEGIEIFDISKQSSEMNYMVVATASNTTLTKGIADYVEETLKKDGIKLLRRDGVNNWIVLDYNEVLVHIFTPEIRDTYHLDKIWTNGKNIFKFEDVKKMLEKEIKQKKQKEEKDKSKKEVKKPEKKEKTAKPKVEKKTDPKKKEPKKVEKVKKEKSQEGKTKKAKK